MDEQIKQYAVKAVAVITAVVVIVNVVLMALGRASVRTFWFIIIVAAFLAYFILPGLRKKTNS